MRYQIRIEGGLLSSQKEPPPRINEMHEVGIGSVRSRALHEVSPSVVNRSARSDLERDDGQPMPISSVSLPFVERAAVPGFLSESGSQQREGVRDLAHETRSLTALYKEKAHRY